MKSPSVLNLIGWQNLSLSVEWSLYSLKAHCQALCKPTQVWFGGVLCWHGACGGCFTILLVQLTKSDTYDPVRTEVGIAIQFYWARLRVTSWILSLDKSLVDHSDDYQKPSSNLLHGSGNMNNVLFVHHACAGSDASRLYNPCKREHPRMLTRDVIGSVVTVSTPPPLPTSRPVKIVIWIKRWMVPRVSI